MFPSCWCGGVFCTSREAPLSHYTENVPYNGETATWHCCSLQIFSCFLWPVLMTPKRNIATIYAALQKDNTDCTYTFFVIACSLIKKWLSFLTNLKVITWSEGCITPYLLITIKLQFGLLVPAVILKCYENENAQDLYAIYPAFFNPHQLKYTLHRFKAKAPQEMA